MTAQNFSGTKTLPFVLVGALLLLLILLPTVKRLGVWIACWRSRRRLSRQSR